MIDYWKALWEKLRRGQNAFLAWVVHNTHHSPGTAGAKLFLSEDKEQWGTIGGGAMELKVLDRGREALLYEEHIPTIQTLAHRKSGSGDKSGMICAGEQTNLYFLARPDRDLERVEKIISAIKEDKSAWIVITPEGMELVEKDPRFDASPLRLTGSEDDQNWRYEEELLNRKRVAIIGGGHCGLALSRIMNNLGYVVTIFDTRSEVATFKNNNWARHRIVVSDYAEAGPLTTYPQLTHAVVMTTDYPSDVQGLLGAIPEPFPYIGVMGSKAKIYRIFEDLKSHGIAESRFDDLYAPVGLPIDSHTPEEIAISVSAEILKERKNLVPLFQPER